MSKVVTFGELMLRLQPEGYLRISQADKFQATFAGAEANVAVSLANFGEDVFFVSKIPDNLIGQAAVNSLRKYGVDTSFIKREGERLGLFYLEKGASQRPSVVNYDRKNSAVALSESGDFDWDKIFEGVSWFHFTGITPALSDSLADICMDALKIAKRLGITVSCDINFRSKLWTKEKASSVMSRIFEYVDIAIANEDDISDVFNICFDDIDTQNGVLSQKGYEYIARQLTEKFNLKMTAITLRESISANDNKWSALLYDGQDFYNSKQYLIHIVDRVGGGDSFGAGLIYALKNGFDSQKAIDFAVAASCLKQTIEGDYNQVSVQEVMTLANGSSTGRIKR